jgi:hypothetical protein
MTFAELAYLQTTEARQLLAEHAKTDPSVFALKNRNPSLATQLKYHQRAKTKLPSLHAVHAIIPPLAFEQCSSETASLAKTIAGKRCLDLTCGLGIDSFHFSKQFETVIAIEQNAVLAETVRYNAQVMGIQNLDVRTDTAENFIENYRGESFDWVYLDPARRDAQNKKLFLPEDCQPNIVALLPRLKHIAKGILVKLSPLYDVAAAAKQFPDLAAIGVVSIENECKELLLTWQNDPLEPSAKPSVYLKIWDGQSFMTFSEKDIATIPKWTETLANFTPRFIIEPDVAFYKARQLSLFQAYFCQNTVHCKGENSAENGFFLCAKMDKNKMPARIFSIEASFDYQPKKINSYLNTLNIKALNIVQRNFPFSVADIRKALKIKEGGSDFLICSLWQGKKMAWLAKRCQ